MILSTRGLSIAINQKIICHELNLSIQAGEIWGILGANGSGKTTFLHTLAGLLPIQAGEVWLGANKLHQLPRKSIAQSIGLLFQDTAFSFPQTVWDFCLGGRFPHLAYFKQASAHDHQITERALACVGLSNYKQKLTTQLSGGEKRRLAMAAVLAQTPNLYLLDEPTNHLDLRYQIQLLQHLRTLTHTGIMLSLHDINIAQYLCTHVLLLFNDGKTLHGPTAALLTSKNLQDLYGYNLPDAIALGMIKA